jgi:hypothetical protein
MIGLYRVGTAKKRESVKRHARVTLWDQFRNAGRIKSARDSRGVFAAKCIALHRIPVDLHYSAVH